jgi:hypothetical protein
LLTTLQARNSPQITISTASDSSENATAAAVVIPIDPVPTHSQTTGQEQENEDLDAQLLAEMGTSPSQVFQVAQVHSGIQAAAQPPATLAATPAAAAAEPAGQQPKKCGRPKGSKDKQPRKKTGTQAAGT